MLNHGAPLRFGAAGAGRSSDTPHSVQPKGRSGLGGALAHAAILLIEDDDNVAEAVTYVLQKEGYAVEHCSDAFDALERLRSGAPLPDMILLDLLLPRMDGWEFRVEQRRHPALAEIPVIALSADDSAKARAIDAVAFLLKPVQHQRLLATVRQVRDTIERQRDVEHASHDERIGALAAIASGIAHEINNPLAAVIGSLELVALRSAQIAPALDELHRQRLSSLQALVSEAHNGSLRIAEVARNIAAFARADRGQAVPVDVQSVLEASLGLVGNELRHRGRLQRSYAQVSPVVGQAATLGHAFLHILLYVLRTLGEDSEEAVIRVSIGAQDDRVIVSIGQVEPGRDVLESDGMNAARDGGGVRSLGLGVGWAACQRALAAMGGKVEVQTASSGSNTFRVSLPAHRPAQRGQTRGRGDGADAPRIRVLAIDDEKMMCDMLEAMLSDTFDLVTCLDARAGLDRLLHEPFDAVLCDLMMPGFNGMELHEQLKQKRPEMAECVLFMTGGTFTDEARAFLDEPGRKHIDKPFRVDELIQKIKAMVAERRAAGPEARLH